MTHYKEGEPFVSILTPVYNGEQYLAQCIESVLSQKYENWEYVIVNNCSTDQSREIAEKYAQTEDRIRIHNNREHLPQMQNLNHAFRQISDKSKYCKVVHADDMLFKNCLVEMVSIAETHPSVGIVSSYRLDGRKVGLYGLPYPSHFNDGREISRDFLLGNSYYFGSPSSLLIRSSQIRKRDRIYDESYLESDISACLDILSESDFGFVHQVLTYTRRHENSATKRVTKKHSTHMLGYLKMHLEYGPHYLSDEEYEQEIKWQEEVFYIQFAQNMLSLRMREAYKRHSKELLSIDFKVKHGKLFKYLCRELCRNILHKIGVEIKRRKAP